MTSLPVALLALLLASTPALAIPDTLTTTQSPPAGNSSQSMPEPTNSLPSGAGTERSTQPPGSNLGAVPTYPDDLAQRPAPPVVQDAQ